jgi:gas vesicle protein
MLTSQAPEAVASPERTFVMANDDYRRDSGDSVSTRLTYLLIGGGIGAVIALLFAPKSGQELRGDIADATRKGIDKSREAAQQVGERAGEYYDATRERATELYSQASEKASDLYTQASSKVGEVAQTARETATRQTSTVAAAIDAGKKAYQEEKRKTEMSGRIEAAPKYTEKAN